ncbi:MAG TPA: adenylyl-sulfate kinase [Prolixibacteraceae bacterium]|nr:adenylyl-sulfate kinase [Prolixibacteraceae bacterium]
MNHIYPVFEQIISREIKEEKLHQKAKVIWFTGLSGSGKTTLASTLEKELFKMGFLTQVLDGDNIRMGINSNLGFSPSDRRENIRRIAEIAKLFINCGVITLCAFVSPTERIRSIVSDIVGADDFYEIYLSTPLETCEERDTKGLYAKARKGEILDFTGISAPFETPANSDLIIDTTTQTIEQSLAVLLEKILPMIKA